MRAARGFTLLELLVALAAFALLAAAAHGALQSMSRAAVAQRDASARLQTLQLAFGRLERELAQAVPVAPGAGLPALSGDPQALEFTTLGETGWSPEAALRGVRYHLEDGRLLRQASTSTSAPAPDPRVPAQQFVLDDVAELRLAYYARPEGWREAWRPSESVPLPAAVRIELETTAGERFARVVELPGDRP